MANTEIGPLLSALGALIAAAGGVVEADSSLLFAEMQGRKLECMVYHDSGDVIVEAPCSREMAATVRLVRQLEAPKKRWATFAYRLQDDRFDLKLGYADDQSAEETPADRRERLVKAWADEFTPTEKYDNGAKAPGT